MAIAPAAPTAPSTRSARCRNISGPSRPLCAELSRRTTRGLSRSDGSRRHRLAVVARKIRFSTQSGSQPTGQDWLARAKRLEAIGYATLSMPDHMVGGAWSNMPALGAAAAVTTKLRLGNLVLDNDFRNPVVLAREFAA